MMDSGSEDFRDVYAETTALSLVLVELFRHLRVHGIVAAPIFDGATSALKDIVTRQAPQSGSAEEQFFNSTARNITVLRTIVLGRTAPAVSTGKN